MKIKRFEISFIELHFGVMIGIYDRVWGFTIFRITGASLLSITYGSISRYLTVEFLFKKFFKSRRSR